MIRVKKSGVKSYYTEKSNKHSLSVVILQFKSP